MIRAFDDSIAGLVLAAGNSSRLGAPKQLLQYGGRTLLAHAIHGAQQIFSPILVITGHDPDGAIAKEATDAGALVKRNPHWQNGLGTTIRHGIDSLFAIQGSSFKAVALLLCDQPLVTAENLRELANLSTSQNLVAAAYNNTVGPPAIIGQRFFPQLLELPDHQGAKQLLLANSDSLVTVPLPQGATDIDTLEDYHALAKPPEFGT